MDTPEELKKWFVKMGYRGKLPTDLTPVCNASTVCLWKEVMNKVKPRDEITRIRNNIIINYFNKSSTSEIKQHRKYIYLLKSKSKDLENQLCNIKDMLQTSISLTPIESDNEDEAKDLLKQCTGKLEEIVQNEQEKTNSFSKSKDFTEFLDFSFEGILSSSPISEKRCSKDALCNTLTNSEKVVKPMIENLLDGYSRQSIWNSLYIINEMEKNSNYETEATSLAVLYGKHAEFEIKTMRLNLNVKKLKKQVQFLQEQIFREVAEKYPTYSVDLQEAIKLEQREVNICAQARYLREKINLMQEDDNTTDVSRIETKVQQLDEEIISVLESLRWNCDFFELLHKDSIQKSRSNCLQLKKLKLFVENLDWIEPLMHNVTLEEINTFVQFPLQYKQLSLQNYIVDEELDTNTLLFLITVLTSPWSPLEVLLINLMKAKEKLAVLKSLKMVHNKTKECKLNYFGEPQCQESYVYYALDKMKSMMHASKDTDLRLKMAGKTIKLWMEMPIKGFISPKRFVRDSNYHHYEQIYEKYYELLS
ncbi:hypothetical protein RN001_010644 [Aquatica leii]|uniref:Uncharacterized protein n=1 Tax=Aquatica leii TaxID=1421715 RepID=A0AAN7P845_9COLE|nr:hypothetical protein RN001_010644 [Aquatica leii]